eukprot:442890-Pleurochrysis_carterae.AAC.2
MQRPGGIAGGRRRTSSMASRGVSALRSSASDCGAVDKSERRRQKRPTRTSSAAEAKCNSLQFVALRDPQHSSPIPCSLPRTPHT